MLRLFSCNRTLSSSFRSFSTSRVIRNEEEELTLRGTKTHQNLIDAFAGESMANRRYMYFAQQADVEGYADAAVIFRSTADGCSFLCDFHITLVCLIHWYFLSGETGHAMGHLEFLEECGDPATDLEFGSTRENLKSAIAGETHEYTDMYPGMARTAREEGFDDVAEWFATLAMAERSHAGRFQKTLDTLE